jgi:hypothetical protein
MSSIGEVSRAIGTALYSGTDTYVDVFERLDGTAIVRVDGKLRVVLREQLSKFRPLPEGGDMSTSDGLGAAASVEQCAVQACSNLAEYLNAQESWNGGDVCEILAAELNKAGFEVKG